MGVYAGTTLSWNQLQENVATGGTVTQITQNGLIYKVHSFTNVGIATFTTSRPLNIEYLIVGGGCGGGGGFNKDACGGGGGAGGFRAGSGFAVTPGSYSITVGGGGTGGAGQVTARASSGGNSSAFGIVSNGGGGGGTYTDNSGAGFVMPGVANGNSSASGDGGAGTTNINGTAGGAFGNAGGGHRGTGQSNNSTAAGGGGGAGGVGGTGVANGAGGAGGVGLVSTISGISTYYAGGGAGGSSQSSGTFGGLGGGGNAGNLNASGSAGLNNTGGGGGGASAGTVALGLISGGNGGSGIVIIRYAIGVGSTIITVTDGSTSDKAAPSASYLVSLGLTTDGVYWINLPTAGPTQIYCILNPIYDGGGWMMAMKATTGTTFNYSANYWTTANTLNPTENNRNNGDAKFNSMNYFQSNDMMAIWPDISNGGSIPSSTLGWTWLQNNFNDGTRITPISFFGITYPTMNPGGSGKFIRDAKTFSGWASGVFSSQTDIRFYGFNYTDNPGYGTNARCRWGFGWNENGEGLYPSNNVSYIGSNDVAGGIGMDSGFGSYSAGDRINCCQDTTGINRSARVEIYVR